MNRTIILLFVSVLLLFGCINTAQHTTASNPSASSQIPPAQTSGQQSSSGNYQFKLFSASELQSINLQGSDVPSDFVFDDNQSNGLITNAYIYTAGDNQSALVLISRGWIADYDVQYDKEVPFSANNATGFAMVSIDSQISAYSNASALVCELNSAKSYYLSINSTLLTPTRSFGSGKSVLLHGYFSDAIYGKNADEAYELKFYRGNLFVNLEVAGPAGSLNQSLIEQVGISEDQRLSNACRNNCEPPPVSCNE